MSTTTEGFRYSQLSPEAKAVARKWWRGTGWTGWDDHGALHELLDDELAHTHGLTDCRLHYSLSCCQGDGVAFEGNPDLEVWAKSDERMAAILGQMTLWLVAHRVDEHNFYCTITHNGHNGHYCHSNSMTLDISRELWPPAGADMDWWAGVEEDFHELLTGLEEYCGERIKAISKALEETGYAAIEYHESDEYIDETLKAHDGRYLWDEGGDFLEWVAIVQPAVLCATRRQTEGR